MANMEDLLHGIKEFQKNLDKNLDHQDIDDFRILLNDSVDREYQRLKELSKSVSKDNAQLRSSPNTFFQFNSLFPL